MKRDFTNNISLDESEREFQDLIGAIADIPDLEPPETLLPVIMAELSPKKAPWWKRFLNRLYLPVSLTPVRLIPAGVALALGLIVAFYAGVYYGTQKTAPVVAQNTLPVENAATVVFSLKDPHASKVYVIGSFNHWSPKGYEMRYDKKTGTWVLPVKLPEGQYEYAFLLNGKTIMPDPKALMQKDDGFGNKNSILIVERQDGKTQS